MDKKRKWAVIGSILLMTVLSIITAYFMISRYYRDKFTFGTYINGVYCTGKTVEEVNSILVGQYTQRCITVILEDGSTQELILDRSIFEPDYTMALEILMEKQEKQNPYEWGKNLFSPQYHTISEPIITYYDTEKLIDAIRKLPCTNQQPHDFYLYIGMSEDGYVLRDSTQAFYDPDFAEIDIFLAVIEGKTQIDLVEEGSYNHRIPVDMEMAAVYKEWEAVDAFQNLEISYEMGEQIETISKAWMAKFLTLNDGTSEGMFLKDESGNFIISEDMVRRFVDELADRYDTYGVERQYTTITGQNVTVHGGIYGNQIDREAEVLWLLETLQSGQSAQRIPEYTHLALYQGADDIGPTYIEVDLTAQKLYFIKKREIVLETDIVSGNLSWRLGTPSRVGYIQGKYRNRVLRGPGYESFVNYWMPVYRNIGIHDATWRNKFGGDIYQTNGSHGCVNVPYDQMVILFDEVENGIPVIMYYTQEVDESRINNK